MTGLPATPRATAAPWLRPAAAGLLAVAADPPDRAGVLADPGALLHVVRYCRPTPDPLTFALSAAVLGQPAVCETAAALLERPDARGPDWTLSGAAARPLRFGRVMAEVAAGLAARSGLCSPDAARVVGLLAPLGWYAALAADPDAVARCLADGVFPDEPHATATKHLGFEPAALARRAAARWRLPAPFAAVVGFLGLPPEAAAAVGAHAGLHRVARAAAVEAGRRTGFPLLPTADPADDPLGEAAAGIAADIPPQAADLPDVPDAPPALLARLLRATAKARARTAALLVADLEQQVDRLADALADGRTRFEVAVRDAKLAALAEFAAGASHEINNPLAVISGNAQLLLAGEPDPDRRRKLAAVARAAGRVSDILAETRQFARPPAPRAGPVSVAGAVRAALAAVRPMAVEKGATLDAAGLDADPVAVVADPGQLTQALAHLLRNAVEAAPPDGWVRVRAVRRGSRVEVAVEDSGGGPTGAAVPHLFDPFFSGRDAGRGRGLGLSVAWRFARINGGDLRYARPAGGPTRFVLTLPAAEAGGGLPNVA